MKTWKGVKGWKYMLWDEGAIDGLGLKNRKLYDFYISKRCYHGASDVARLEILNAHGGIYIDADTERLEDIGELMDCDFFAVEANRPGRVANGIIASIPGHPIISAYIKAMGEAKEVMPPWSTIGGTLFTRMISENRTARTSILPPHTFYPFDSKGITSRTSGKTYARHVWGTTHNLYGKI